MILSITTNSESELGQLSDCLIEVPAATKHRREDEAKRIQPLSSLFDQCVHVLCDAICLKYLDENKLEHAEIFVKHSNIQYKEKS